MALVSRAAHVRGGRPVHPVRLAALLSLLAMFGPFAIDAFFPAFNSVARELGASPLLMQQTISVYLIAYAVMSLFHGPLSDACGRRPVVLTGVLVYTVGSVGCALATSIELLLLFRVVQGLATGAGLIVGRAIVRDLYDGPEAQRVMSLVSLFFGVAPALAPLVGGLVYGAAGWHAVFWMLALFGALLLLLCWQSLPETHAPERRTRFSPGPLLATYRAIALDGRFVLLVAASGFNFGGQFLYISSAPAFIEKHLGLGTLGYPWFFVPMVTGMMGGAALSARLAGVIAARSQVRLGYALIAAGTLANLAYNLSVARPAVPWAVAPIFVTAMGVALVFPVLSLKMLDRWPGNRGAASSVQAFLWGVITGLVAALAAPALSGHHATLAAGAAASVLVGWICWLAYARITPLRPAEIDVHRVEPAPD